MLVFLEITGVNMIFRVSLMKNGEEIVSVGGAMEPSAKNMGISASNSVLLDLARVCHYSSITTKLFEYFE